MALSLNWFIKQWSYTLHAITIKTCFENQDSGSHFILEPSLTTKPKLMHNFCARWIKCNTAKSKPIHSNPWSCPDKNRKTAHYSLYRLSCAILTVLTHSRVKNNSNLFKIKSLFPLFPNNAFTCNAPTFVKAEYPMLTVRPHVRWWSYHQRMINFYEHLPTSVESCMSIQKSWVSYSVQTRKYSQQTIGLNFYTEKKKLSFAHSESCTGHCCCNSPNVISSFAQMCFNLKYTWFALVLKVGL